MTPDMLNQFLQHGYFLCSPLFNKVWCLIDDEVDYSAKPVLEKNFFYHSNFKRSLQNPWASGNQWYELSVSKFFKLIKNQSFQKPFVNWHPLQKNKYIRFFVETQKEIKKNNIQKAVPFFQKIGQTQLTVKNLVYFLNQLSALRKNKTIFMYGHWNFQKQYLQLGASPELLFVKNKNVISTIALAGTSTQPLQDFKKTKMKDEHNYVIKDLYDSLKQYGHVRKSKTYTVKFNQYFHKKTKISVQNLNSQVKFDQLLDSLYPSAALGAYPRQKGLDFLEQIENKLRVNRGFFASPYGIQTRDDFMLCIGTIRGIEWNQDQLSITAGGGVVSQSQLSAEWKEILLKLKSIQNIFGL